MGFWPSLRFTSRGSWRGIYETPRFLHKILDRPLKLVYLVSMDVVRRWTAKVRGWNGILAQLAIHFQGKLEGYL
jgi:hypothetical protein